MKKHPTKSKLHGNTKAIIYIVERGKTYAIPRKIAEKYIVDTEDENKNISADELFADLDKKFTQAGVLLKGLRTREGLTQEEFAKAIGIDQPNLSSMENGKRPIGKELAKRIEKEFGVDYRYFL